MCIWLGQILVAAPKIVSLCCSMQDLDFVSSVEGSSSLTWAPCTGSKSLSPWTPGEVPVVYIFINKYVLLQNRDITGNIRKSPCTLPSNSQAHSNFAGKPNSVFIPKKMTFQNYS